MLLKERRKKRNGERRKESKKERETGGLKSSLHARGGKGDE